MDTPLDGAAYRPGYTPALLRGITIDPRMARFPRQLSGLDDLNPHLARAFEESMGPGEGIRQVLYAPGQRILHHRGRGLWSWVHALLGWEVSPDWVIVVTSECLHLASAPAGRSPGPVERIPFDRFVSLEIGSVLLKSWGEWAWIGQTQIEQARIYFNTVGQRLFLQAMAAIRADHAPQAAPPQMDRGLEKLQPLPFKFRTLITCDLLMPGEQVRAAAFRPAFAEMMWRKAPAIALAVTSNSLIVVEEEGAKTAGGWGLTARYIPTRTIDRVAIARAGQSFWLEIEQATPFGPAGVRVPFEAPCEPAFREMIRMIVPGGASALHP